MDLSKYDKIEHADGRIELIPKKHDLDKNQDLDWVPEGEYWQINLCFGGLKTDFAIIDSELKFGNYFKNRESAKRASDYIRTHMHLINVHELVEPECVEKAITSQWYLLPDGRIINLSFYLSNALPPYSTKEKAVQAREILIKRGIIKEQTSDE